MDLFDMKMEKFKLQSRWKFKPMLMVSCTLSEDVASTGFGRSEDMFFLISVNQIISLDLLLSCVWRAIGVDHQMCESGCMTDRAMSLVTMNYQMAFSTAVGGDENVCLFYAMTVYLSSVSKSLRRWIEAEIVPKPSSRTYPQQVGAYEPHLFSLQLNQEGMCDEE